MCLAALGASTFTGPGCQAGWQGCLLQQPVRHLHSIRGFPAETAHTRYISTHICHAGKYDESMILASNDTDVPVLPQTYCCAKLLCQHCTAGCEVADHLCLKFNANACRSMVSAVGCCKCCSVRCLQTWPW